MSYPREELPESLLQYAVDRLNAERQSAGAPCKICGAETRLFDVLDFKKSCHPDLYPDGLAGVPVLYRSCGSCRFIFTTFFDAFTPEQWHRHVYNDGYAAVDPEYLEIRPRRNVPEIELLLAGRKEETIGLDYGGGNGVTAGMLRQRGWTYDSHDPFGATDVRPENLGRYNFCSSFEVFEHSPDPVATLSEIIRMASPERLMLFVGTSIHDAHVRPDGRLSWWYAAPRNGHISLYSRSALRQLGERFGLSYVSLSAGTHLFLRGIPQREARFALLRSKVLQKLRRTLPFV